MPDIKIKINEVAIENKYGVYGDESKEKGKSISSIVRFGGSIEPGCSLEEFVPQVDALMDQAFDIARRGVKRASQDEETGW